MYTGNQPSLSLSDSNDCPFVLPPSWGSHSLKNTVSPLEFIRPQVHWKMTIYYWRGILSIVEFWLEVKKKKSRHMQVCLIILLLGIEYHL